MKLLAQQDNVFAIFNSLGTEHNLTTRPYLNAVGVPQLFVGSGGRTFGSDYKQYKWTIGYQPNYLAEGTIYGRQVAKSTPKARIAVLYQNDDYGKDLLNGLRRASVRGRSRSSRRRATTPTTPTCGCRSPSSNPRRRTR